MKAKKIWTVILTLVFTAALLFGLSRLTRRKDAINMYLDFFERPEEYDVLLFGTSHMLDGVSPRFLWQEYGIASYNLASRGARMPMVYWQLVNALDYAVPRLVVVDCMWLCDPYKASTSMGFIHDAWDFFPMSMNKLRAIDDLWTDNYLQTKEQKPELLFPFITYHNRWSELTAEDFERPDRVLKGGQLLSGVAVPIEPQPSAESAPVTEDTIGVPYLYKIIELCRERGIPLLLTYLPFPAPESSYQEANLAGDIAAECGVPWLNLLEAPPVDMSIDCYDSDSHLNISGNMKASLSLGAYIRAHFDIPDRRDDPAYAHWEEEYPLFAAYLAEELEQQQTPESYLSFLHVWDGPITLYVPAGSPVYDDPRLLRLIENIPREGGLTVLGEPEKPYTLFVDNLNRELRENGEGDTPPLTEEADLAVWLFDREGAPPEGPSRSFRLERD